MVDKGPVGVYIVLILIVIIVIVVAVLLIYRDYLKDHENNNDKNAAVAEITKSESEENTDNILNNELLDKSVELKREPLVNKLMGYDNARLNRIINNPKLYNQEVVDKAIEILGRREAWEQIKNFTDSELLEIAMTDSDLYAANVGILS